MGRRRYKYADLPPRMLCRTRAGGKYYYYATPGLPRREIALGSNITAARAAYALLQVQDKPRRIPVPQMWWARLSRLARNNARIKGIPFLMTTEQIKELLDRSEGRCAVSGIRFDFTIKGAKRIRPWVPSVDRIDSNGPYSVENCRLVCAAVNLAMNQFGDEVFWKIVVATGGMLRRGNLRTDPLELRTGGVEKADP